MKASEDTKLRISISPKRSSVFSVQEIRTRLGRTVPEHLISPKGETHFRPDKWRMAVTVDAMFHAVDGEIHAPSIRTSYRTPSVTAASADLSADQTHEHAQTVNANLHPQRQIVPPRFRDRNLS